MKTWIRWCLLLPLLWSSPLVKAADASDEYVSIYSLLTKGDEMLGSGLRTEAAQFYSDAHRKLRAFQSANPNWNPKVVRFRLKYLGERLASLPMVSAPTPAVSATSPGSVATQQPNSGDELRMVEGQLAAANEQLRQLTADNSLLLSKLREAMAARPAEVDPKQVRRAEEKILELQKENELIEVQLNRALNAQASDQRQEAQRLSQARVASDKVVADLRSKLAEAEQAAQQGRRDAETRAANESRLTQEVAGLRKQLAEAKSQAATTPAPAPARPMIDPNELVRLRQDNEALRHLLSQAQAAAKNMSGQAALGNQTALNNQVAALTQERDELREQLRTATQGDDLDTLENLMRENAMLKRQVAEAGSGGGSKGASDSSKALAKLTRENESLKADLAKARRGGDRERSSWLSRFSRRRSTTLSDLEARLAVFEAEKEPYTKEELALLKGTELAKAEVPTRDAGSIAGSPGNNLTQAAAELEGQAQEAARQGQYSLAESKFNEILDLIPSHAPTLASLALTQIKQEKFGAAEANLEAALEAESENTYALFLMGLLRMNQQRFDDAVTVLSRAAVLDPDDAEAQNHLGVALTEVGHRGPAEAALRKAIRLRPGYADAHVNLAVVYASQNPPFKELAKYHYQQAINNGHPADPRVEQLLSDSN